MRLLEGYDGADLTDLRGQMCGKLYARSGHDRVRSSRPGGDPCGGSARSPTVSPLAGGLGQLCAFLDRRRQAEHRARPDAVERPLRRALDLGATPTRWSRAFAGALDPLGLGEPALRAVYPQPCSPSISGFGRK